MFLYATDLDGDASDNMLSKRGTQAGERVAVWSIARLPVVLAPGAQVEKAPLVVIVFVVVTTVTVTNEHTH